ncbi:MAG: sigma-54-dependent transcriptional regulator [Candidatus Rokuibacteriota bacterium]
MARILVVEDAAAERKALTQLLEQWGYEVVAASSAEEAIKLAETESPAVVLSDLVLPEMDGLALLEALHAIGVRPAVLLMTGHASIESAVKAMRQGAFDYLTKPVDPVRLGVLLEKAIAQESLTREVHLLRRQLRQQGGFGRLIGNSKRMQEVYRWIELSATSSASVFIHGESGTGKELVARTIHDLSARAAKPFVALNCAAIPESLIESELFGHEHGAFTGAHERRAGCFELAHQGTVFLDEIAEMEVSTQAKLLRVLQDGTFRRVGGKTEISVDVRIIAATNRVPTEAVSAKQLREDLFYRLNVFSIPLPLLRERPEDITLLCETFIDEFNRNDQLELLGVETEALRALEQYAWPGNIRELRNVVQRAAVITRRGMIPLSNLPDSVTRGETPRPVQHRPRSFDELEQQLITRALEDHGGDQRQAAARMGLSLATFKEKLAKRRVPPPPS